MEQIEVFADVGCPFAHAGLRLLATYRRERELSTPRLRVRAWPLELVNDALHSGRHLAPEVAALRDDAAPDLFAGFDAERFPTTTLPALAATAAAYRTGPELGEAFSLAVRDALWEHGIDVSDPQVLRHLGKGLGVPVATEADEATVRADLADGRRRDVIGSPHFFTPDGDFFCPSLDISHEGGGMHVAFDRDGFEQFIHAVFA